MAVAVDVDALVRAHRIDLLPILVGFHPSDPEDVGAAAMDAFMRAVTEANEANGKLPGTVTASGSSGWLGPLGPVGAIDIHKSDEAVVSWTRTLAAALEEQGWNGRLVEEAQTFPKVLDQGVHVMSAVLFLSGWGIGPERRAFPVWREDKDVARYLAYWVTDWVGRPGGPLYLAAAGQCHAMPPRLIAHRLESFNHGVDVVWSPDREHLRQVFFDHAGRLIVSVKDADGGWEVEARQLREVLQSLAHLCEYALVRRSYSVVGNAIDVLNRPELKIAGVAAQRPRPPLDYYRFRRHLDHSKAPDAYGMQLMGPDHLAQLRALDGWRREPVIAGDATLVEAVDLHPWFSGPVPDDAILAAARTSFGPVILWDQPPWEEVPGSRDP